MSFITFIIPTIGRESIHRAVDSLHKQTDSDWSAIINFDGTNPNIDSTDKIQIIKSTKIGIAGKVRNAVFPKVESEWVGFLDDDDYLKETYVEKLKTYSCELDLVIFSMQWTFTGRIIPRIGTQILECGDIGISFSVRNDFIQQNNIMFYDSVLEDYDFLQKCIKNNARYKITHDVQYYVPQESKWK